MERFRLIAEINIPGKDIYSLLLNFLQNPIAKNTKTSFQPTLFLPHFKQYL